MSSASFSMDSSVSTSSKDSNCKESVEDGPRPRCAACNELIFSGEYTRAMGKDWHKEHFRCWQSGCEKWLTGQRYVIREGHPFCLICFEQIFADVCEECTKPIGINVKEMTFEDRHWHEKCFICHKCGKSLIDLEFGAKGSQLYCGPCYGEFGKRCDECGGGFDAGMKITEYKNKNLHEHCFKCFKCQTPVTGGSFISEENDVFCKDCWKLKKCIRCVKCSELIDAEGIVFKDEPWHKECFKCMDCDSQLPTNKFTVKDDRVLCLDCYAKSYADKCFACQKPIVARTSLDPYNTFTRFVAFKDRKWHATCFICTLCHSKLENSGFLVDGPDLLCHECAKKKIIGAAAD